MLSRVVIGQTRFTLPGLVVDAKGIARGREAAVRFAGWDRLVAFLRFYTSGNNLDDLGQVRLLQVRRENGPREIVLLASRVSPVLAEIVAQAARTAGSPVFTGASRHFVPMREVAAPLGWDVDRVSDAPAEFLFYRADGVDAYRGEEEVALSALLLRLEPQRVPRGDAALRSEPLFVLARRGVAGPLAGYLHHAEQGPAGNAGFRAFGAYCVVEGTDVVPDLGGRGREWLFLRLENVPARMQGLLTGTPGLRAATPVGNATNLVVAAGFRHPVHLEACRGVLPADKFFFFPPPPESVWVIDPIPTLAPLADIVRLEMPLAAPASKTALRPAETAWPELAVDVQLVPSKSESGRVVGALVPRRALPWLRRLVYALPAMALRRLRVALLEDGVLVLADNELEALPFGTLLSSPRPGVFVPVGMTLRPAVSPRVLAERFGLSDGAALVFPGSDDEGSTRMPFLVPRASIHPLESRVLLDPELPPPPTREPLPSFPEQEVDIVNDPVGLWEMPLWGGKSRSR